MLLCCCKFWEFKKISGHLHKGKTTLDNLSIGELGSQLILIFSGQRKLQVINPYLCSPNLQALPCPKIDMQTLIRLKFLLFRTIFESQAGPPSVLPSPAAKSTTAALNFGPCFRGRGWKRAVRRPVGRLSRRSRGEGLGDAETESSL